MESSKVPNPWGKVPVDSSDGVGDGLREGGD